MFLDASKIFNQMQSHSKKIVKFLEAAFSNDDCDDDFRPHVTATEKVASALKDGMAELREQLATMKMVKARKEKKQDKCWMMLMVMKMVMKRSCPI